MSKIVNIVVNTFINDSRVLRTAISGIKAGHEAIVIAQHKPGLPTTQIINEVKVIRIKLYTQHLPKKFFFQVFKYIEFVYKAVRLTVKFRPTVVHTHDLTALPVGYLSKIFAKCKLIYDSHEFFMYRNTKISFVKIAKIYEKYLANKSDMVITVSESIAVGLQNSLSLKKKPLVVLNVPYRRILQNEEPKLRRELKLNDTFIFLYQGGLQKGRGVELLLEAMKFLERANAVLVVLGGGALKDSLVARYSELINDGKVIFHPAVPQNELHRWTMDADVGVHPMVGNCLNHKYALPNKLFEYIQSGLVVIVSNLPEMEKLVVQEDVGLIFQDGDLQSIINCMRRIFDDNNLRNRLKGNLNSVASKYNWEVEEVKLLNAYKQILSDNHNSGY